MSSGIRKKRATSGRKPLTAGVKNQVFEKTGGVCHFCGEKLILAGRWDIDHVVPLLRKGTSELSNLLPVCCECNRLRSAQRPAKIRATMRIGIYARRAIKKQNPTGKKLERYVLKKVAKRWKIDLSKGVDASARARLVDGAVPSS